MDADADHEEVVDVGPLEEVEIVDLDIDIWVWFGDDEKVKECPDERAEEPDEIEYIKSLKANVCVLDIGVMVLSEVFEELGYGNNEVE